MGSIPNQPNPNCECGLTHITQWFSQLQHMIPMGCDSANPTQPWLGWWADISCLNHSKKMPR